MSRPFAPGRFRGVLALAAALSTCALARPGVAQDLSGSWRAGSRSVTNRTGSWGGDCPPRLPASDQEPGGSVTITHEGAQLRFSGALRGTTRSCFSQRPGLRRSGGSASGNTWTTRCRTPDSVAERENGTYTFRAEGDSRIVYEETTRWDWQLNESRCQATRTARQVLTRVGAAPTMEAEPDPEEEPADTACTPGEAARIRLGGPETTEAGARACFSRQVVDAAGCVLRGVTPSLQIVSAPSGVDAARFPRCFEATRPGRYVIEARHGELQARRTLEVRGDEVDVTGLRASGAGDGREIGPSEATGASALAARAGGGGLPLAAIFAALGLVGLGAILLVVGRKRAAAARREDEAAAAEREVARAEREALEREAAAQAARAAAQAQAAATASAAPSPDKICPTCERHYADGGASHCPADGAELIDPADPRVQAQGMVCPTCRVGQPFGTETCPSDGSKLALYAVFSTRAKREKAASRRCPTCGKSFSGGVTFCPEDGTRLEGGGA